MKILEMVNHCLCYQKYMYDTKILTLDGSVAFGEEKNEAYIYQTCSTKYLYAINMQQIFNPHRAHACAKSALRRIRFRRRRRIRFFRFRFLRDRFWIRRRRRRKLRQQNMASATNAHGFLDQTEQRGEEFRFAILVMGEPAVYLLFISDHIIGLAFQFDSERCRDSSVLQLLHSALYVF